jgi:hypothetical protein
MNFWHYNIKLFHYLSRFSDSKTRRLFKAENIKIGGAEKNESKRLHKVRERESGMLSGDDGREATEG